MRTHNSAQCERIAPLTASAFQRTKPAHQLVYLMQMTGTNEDHAMHQANASGAMHNPGYGPFLALNNGRLALGSLSRPAWKRQPPHLRKLQKCRKKAFKNKEQSSELART